MHLSALVCCWSSVSIRLIIYKFINMFPLDYTAVAVSGNVGICKLFQPHQLNWCCLLPFKLTVLSRYRNCCVFSSHTLQIEISANCKIIPECVCPRLHNCCGEWKDWDPVNWFNHTSWVAIVTPTDRPKAVRNRCVIEVFGGVFVLSLCFIECSVGARAFVIGLS